MSTKHKTKEEAEAEVGSLSKGTVDIFCPLHFAGECNHRCPCYQAPSFQKQELSESVIFWVYPANCNNAMFFNTCQGGNY